MAKVLIVIPHDRFRDEEFTGVVDTLKGANHEVMIGSTHHTEAKGHFGLLVKPDINVRFVEPGDYDAFIFIGGRGIEEFIFESYLSNLIQSAFYERKLIGAIGMAVEVLTYAGILTGRKVTCDTGTIQLVENVGAFYTGRIVEQDGEIITGAGIRSVDEFAKTVVKGLEWRTNRKAPIL